MPNGNLQYRRGEIWWVNLDPTVGNETAKKRPCLILQNDVGNSRSDTTMIAPLLKGSKNYPFVVNVEATRENGLDENRGIHLDDREEEDDDDSLMIRLFLDFALNATLKNQDLERYTLEMSAAAKDLLIGVAVDDE